MLPNILPFARKIAPWARVIFHAPDLHFLRETRQAEYTKDPKALVQAMKIQDREVAIMAASDHVVLVSPAEVPFLKDLLPNKAISVFPALYTPLIADPKGPKDRRHVFFLGGFAHKPNVDAVQWFSSKVWPLIHAALPDAEFHIIGAEAPKSVSDLGLIPGVKVMGFIEVNSP